MGDAYSAIGALACGLGAVLVAFPLEAGWAALVLHAARTTAHTAAVSASEHRRPRRTGRATG